MRGDDRADNDRPGLLLCLYPGLRRRFSAFER